MQAFPTILYAFPMCCVVWTWDSLFYGASDFVYNAKAVAVASLCGVVGGPRLEARGHGLSLFRHVVFVCGFFCPPVVLLVPCASFLPSPFARVACAWALVAV